MKNPESTTAAGAVGSPLDGRVGRPRASASLSATLLRAAELLEEDAASLRACHTVGRKWDAEEVAARAAYEELRAVAKQLRKVNAYMAINPLGGPAKALDACADSIRAGDPVDFAMANFGLAWAPNVRAKPALPATRE